MSSSGDMSGMDKDSEFDSEEEDLEFHLYQQLYFEPNSDIAEADTKSRSATQKHQDRKNISETCDEQFLQLDSCQLNQIHEPDHNPKVKSSTPSLTLSTAASDIHEAQHPQFDSCIFVDTAEGAELSLTDFTAKLSTENTQNHRTPQQKEFQGNSGHEISFRLSNDDPFEKRNAVPLQSVRERLSSTCSDGSIPGSVPLDRLYCNLVTSDEEEDAIIKNKLIMKDIERNDQVGNKEKAKADSNKRKRRSSCSDDEAEDSRCNNLITAASKNAISLGDVCQLGEDSTSDDDIYVLPPPKPRNPEILTLGSSSDGEVEAGSRDGTCIKTRNNKYRKIEKPLSLALSNKNKDGKSEAVHQMSGSRGKQDRKVGDSVAAESESDSNDVDMPEAIKGTDLILNIDKSLSGWVKTITQDPDTNKKKKKVTKKPHKSIRHSVDFTKGRPNTMRKPSCEKWTQSMANFYDSDVSDDFNVSEIHLQQSDSPADWHLIAADYQISQRKRYYNAFEKCKLCKQEGHTTNKCPRVPVCHLCSRTDHSSRTDCPENCCFKCGGEPHFFCPITEVARTCDLCGFPGHHKNLCPDLWRRFHLTTNGMIAQSPTEQTARLLGKRYCYSCGKQGHYGHECPARFQNRLYLQVPQHVISYCCPVNLEDGNFVVNIDGAQSTPPAKTVTTMPIKPDDVGKIIGKKGAVVKSIIKESGAHVRVLQEGQPQVLLFGPSEARSMAQGIIEVLIGKRKGEHVDRVKHLNNSNNNSYSMPTTSGMSDNPSLTCGVSDNASIAAGGSDSSLNNSWCEQFLSHLDRRKDHVLKTMKTLMKSIYCKKLISLSASIKKLKSFRLQRKSVPSMKPTEAVKRHLSKIAMHVLGEGYGDGHKIHDKITNLLKQVQSCPSSTVPENICVEIAKTLEPFHEPSVEKLDKLLKYAERYTLAYLRKRAAERKTAVKLNKELNKNVVPNENKNVNAKSSVNKKRINNKKKNKALKKRKAKKVKNEHANKVKT